MGYTDESTRGILNNYGSKYTKYSGGNNAHSSVSTHDEEDDNLSIFSISNEHETSTNIHELSDLYDLLDNDSIELKRSNIAFGSSPVKYTSSPLRLSPTKKLKNDYQDHLFKMRSGNSNQNSPIKRKNVSRENHHPSPFYDISMDSTHEASFDSFDRRIDQLFKESDENKRSSIRKELLDDNDDKSELIIRETHKLVNNIPSGIASETESARYSTILRASIDKLTSNLKRLKDENRNFQRSNDDFRARNILLDNEVSDLNSRNSRLAQENMELKQEVDQLRRQLKQQTPQHNSQLKRENDLLREKLIKYKNLYVATQQPAQSIKQGVVEGSKEQHQNANDEELEVLKNSLSKALGDMKEKENIEPINVRPRISNHNYKTLPLFEELIDRIKKDTAAKNQNAGILNPSLADSSGAEDSCSSAYRNDPERHDNLLHKVLDSLESNKELYSAILSIAEQSHLANSTPITRDKVKRPNMGANAESEPVSQPSTKDAVSSINHEIVFKCYACCKEDNENIDSEKHQNNGISASRGIDTSCKRCTKVSRESSVDWPPKEKNDTINLMGEYKWCI
ncbi:uncharacterized protein RJT20DRAFT_472 [Scheffersomyces xylosifermentans]|uniref:uncharacterized protein n=1 Tax=Scheffersomyces xylosifermentans TaxID=1304137 RepID=UPI00315D3EFB